MSLKRALETDCNSLVRLVEPVIFQILEPAASLFLYFDL